MCVNTMCIFHCACSPLVAFLGHFPSLVTNVICGLVVRIKPSNVCYVHFCLTVCYFDFSCIVRCFVPLRAKCFVCFPCCFDCVRSHCSTQLPHFFVSLWSYYRCIFNFGCNFAVTVDAFTSVGSCFAIVDNLSAVARYFVIMDASTVVAQLSLFMPCARHGYRYRHVRLQTALKFSFGSWCVCGWCTFSDLPSVLSERFIRWVLRWFHRLVFSRIFKPLYEGVRLFTFLRTSDDSLGSILHYIRFIDVEAISEYDERSWM